MVKRKNAAKEFGKNSGYDSDKSIMDVLAKDLSKYPVLTREQELEVARKVVNGDKKARELMVNSNMRFVIKIAKKYKVQQLNFLDHVQEGAEGLIKAVDRFDPERGFRLCTYAKYWIMQFIELNIANQSRDIRLPVDVHKKLNSCKKIARKLSQEMAREASYEDIADKLDLEVGDVKKLMSLDFITVSADTPIGTDGNKTIQDNLEALPYDGADGVEMLAFLDDMHDKKIIDDRDKNIMLDRSIGDYTLAECGAYLDVSREGARLIQKRAAEKIKNYLDSNGIAVSDFVLENKI